MAQLATLILAIHLAWLALVIFGALWTRGRPVWSAVHIAALLWGIAVEAGPWPCPLTLLEEYFEARAGAAAYHGSFLLHYLDAIVYPNLPGWVVTCAGVAVCGLNLGIYLRRLTRVIAQRRKSG
ncbi:MAG: DUF2784 domain-containing protein [Terracidiphilus sp.]